MRDVRVEGFIEYLQVMALQRRIRFDRRIQQACGMYDHVNCAMTRIANRAITLLAGLRYVCMIQQGYGGYPSVLEATPLLLSGNKS